MNTKLNRCCIAIRKKNTIYIGVKDETLLKGDTYYWLDTKNISVACSNSKNFTLLDDHLKKGRVLKLIASSDTNDSLNNISSKFTKEYSKKMNDILNKIITVQYTYDTVNQLIPKKLPSRINYKPILKDNNIILKIFETRTKTY